ncbi:invasin, partial [Salmonella enterica]|nr:invasin [Salmonella enterica]
MGNTSNTFASPVLARYIAWANIFVQTLFPLAAAFTPVMTARAQSASLVVVDAVSRPYTLGGGETAQSVADKFGVSIDALRVLNQFRTFAKGFDNIGPGDELDVPVKVSDTPAEKTAQNDVQAQRGAALVSLAGAFLSNNPDSDAARSMVTGIASAKASQEIQDWLGKFGSARVSVNSDRHFSLKGSSLEMLYPLYDTQDNMFFTQGALHRTDDRNQANIGLGWRHFVGNNWMTGGNLFVDHDLSRSHTRVGVGAEYWRDYLRLGANGYIGVTRWRNSPDVEDYEERPADGWDVRAEGYLPAYPQLGAKLIYEQYYGDEVGLFGKDDRQKNPHAFTVGVNYTPVPLLTFSAEQRQGKAGENDTRFGVEMNYQLGIPWQHQINPDGLAAMRSLAGSRYALVERNNNIVLEYRKKDVISLKMTDLVTGYAGEQKSLGVSVNSKYGLEHIDWSASPLIAAGGKIVQNGKDWTVVMPDYRSGGEASNSYTVSSVAVDKKGNVSGRAETQVTVMQAAIDTTTSLLSPAVVTLPADGTSQQEFVLNVNDKEGLPVDIAENEISVEKTSGLRGSSNATVSSFTRRAAGEYVMTVTSGTVPETFTITPSARNTKFASADVKLTAD